MDVEWEFRHDRVDCVYFSVNSTKSLGLSGLPIEVECVDRKWQCGDCGHKLKSGQMIWTCCEHSNKWVDKAVAFSTYTFFLFTPSSTSNWFQFTRYQSVVIRAEQQASESRLTNIIQINYLATAAFFSFLYVLNRRRRYNKLNATQRQWIECASRIDRGSRCIH